MVKSIDKHISRLLDSLDTISMYTKDHDCSSFTQDPKTVDACLMQLIVIGENIKNLRSLYPEMSKKLPSNQILGLRNLIAHNYYSVDAEMIRQIIEYKLPEIRLSLQS